MITNLLVANRGEIALRIFRTCRERGVGTVAVYSDADTHALHAEAADAAVRLPGDTPADTYLRVDSVVAAALAAGADAVHPGYGFLSESAEFARAVLDAGLTWIGPSPESIALMGSKVASKRVVAQAGVPVLAELDPDELTDDAMPVLVKASAGGGGRGMRVVHRRADVAAAVTAARAEAASAFGDATVFCERYVERGRHIEVQVLADTHGTVWAVGERECSIQRRHQKVIEEAPSGVDEKLRRALFAAAESVCRAVDYVGAGTVEFLVTDDGEFFFLEMNTRLQVEHPVTECVTGLDLVAWQLRIAEGEALPPELPEARGHAIEARLYAEDPRADWRPGSGTLHRFAVRDVRAEFTVPDRHGIRLDSGVGDGTTVGVHYDPMLAKVIAWGPDRRATARMLAGALEAARLHGLVTNRDLLVAVLRHPAFLAGDTHTDFLDRHAAEVLDAGASEDTVRLSVLAAALADAAHNRARARVLASLPAGWRNVPSAPHTKSYRHGGVEHVVRYTATRSGFVPEDRADVTVESATPERVLLTVGGVRRAFDVCRYPDLVTVDSPQGFVGLTPVPRFGDPAAELAEGSLTAPMPGAVARVAVAVGDEVRAGQPLLWLEAMKMEHRVAAPVDGVVTELAVAPGTQVEQGAVLAVVTPKASPEPTDTTDPADTAKEPA
ncbi:acetyl/propionyl-CoA carboxylase, alpha subunit [Saccharomonospora azurea SZMC 14600]|uniref:acetyl/propionyl/methylcrotonyl-CoA carboxylase subunit alpha n=1 Tax=Saccharomonospora azurea TaxID=40988 RepID=UPI00023FF3F0|nr:biotin carboxylase N-terminal domain-containing protein [Saccharomonospora azurea]EHK83100.1 acetyl/propionyl-CoA carboxylase, alpha subunit [Saccharomonospora azurea SZMC 14600]